MVGFKGQKKYQSQLTNRLNHHQSTLIPVPQRGTSLNKNISIDPIDLKAGFFAKDDIEPQTKDDSSSVASRSIFSGIGKKGYMPPQEQEEAVKQSLDMQLSPRASSSTTFPSQHAQDAQRFSSGSSDAENTRFTSSGSSKASSSPRTPKSVSFAEPAPVQEHEMMPISPKSPGAALHPAVVSTQNVPRPAMYAGPTDSYFFENDYDMSREPSTNDHGPAPAIYDESGNYLDEDDPLDDYYGRASYEEAPTYSSHYDSAPAFQTQQPENHEEHHDEATLLHNDDPISPSKLNRFSKARFGSIAAAIPQFKREKTTDKMTPAYRHNILADQLAAMTYAAKPPGSIRSYNSKNSGRNEKDYADDDSYTGLALHQKGLRTARRWYGSWSTRKIIITVIGVLAAILIAVGTALGVILSRRSIDPGLTPTWRPAPGTTWNIQLQSPITQKPNSAAHVYDIDLFDNNATTIAMLHGMGRKVICYFSAGTYESWRPDASKFPIASIGSNVTGWAGENWVDIRNKDVQAIMHARIDLAISKGCDGVDPDNVNIYSQGGSGFPISLQNGIDFMNDMGVYAHTSDIAIGLKNAPELINGTLHNLDWVITESCVKYSECAPYQIFNTVGKPVLHIEYTESMNATALKEACTAPNTHGFSTILKRSKLDHWSVGCPLGNQGYYNAQENEL